MIEIKANGRSELLLGRQGENLARAIVFDVADWAAEYGSGTAELLVQRPGEETLYPAALVREGDTVRWVLTAADTFVSGRYGRAELRYLSGEAVVKSRIWLTVVDEALADDATADPPEPQQTWVDQVLAAGAAAAKSAEAAEDAKNAAAKSAEDAQGSATGAGSSAAAAAKSAGAAEDAKAAAGKSAEDAQGSATDAGKSAAAAAKSAEGAEAAKDAAGKSAEEIAASYSGIVSDIAAIRTDVAENTKANKKTAESLDALWKLNEGISYDFVDDRTEAYSKTVPAGCISTAVEEIGGKTAIWNQLFKNLLGSSNGCTYKNNADGSIIISGTPTSYYINTSNMTAAMNLAHTYAFVLQIIDNPDGATISFGWLNRPGGTGKINSGTAISVIAQSESNLNRGKSQGFNGFAIGQTISTLTVRASIIDLTRLFGAGNEPSTTDDQRVAWVEQYATAHPEYNAGELLSALVSEVQVADTAGDVSAYPIPAAVQQLPGYGWSAGDVHNSIERVDDGKWQYVQRVGAPATEDGYTVFEEPVTTDISDLMADFVDIFPATAGGSITFANEVKLAVPNAVKYIRSLKDVESV